jgi:hypothetical protein
MSEQIPMPTTMDEIQALLNRDDNATTRVMAVELPRLVHDGDPRCAFLFAGPDSYLLMQHVANFIEALAATAAQKRPNVPVSNTVQ